MDVPFRLYVICSNDTYIVYGGLSASEGWLICGVGWSDLRDRSFIDYLAYFHEDVFLLGVF